jgi:hypothetical protein
LSQPASGATARIGARIDMASRLFRIHPIAALVPGDLVDPRA